MLRCICLAVSFSDFHCNQQTRFFNPLQTHILLQSPPRAARIEVAALQLQWAPHFWSPLLKCSSVMRPVGSFPGNTTPCQPHCWRHKVRNAHWLTRKPTQLSFFQALGASNCDQVTWQLHIFVQSFGITYIHYYTFSGTSSQWESSWRQTFREALILRQYNSSSQINCTIPTVSRL